MREIKFRAWDKERKQMRNVYELNCKREGISVRVSNGYVGTLQIGDLGEAELMQYTGLKDKNGKEIYEGDILATKNDGKDGCDAWNEQIMGAVRWNEIDAYFTGLPYDEESIYGPQYAYIIGNIYENPELLKQ